MLITPRKFIQFLDGRGIIDIAIIPGHLAAHISSLTTNLRIERSYADKLMRKHQLSHNHFLAIQRMIDEGWCVLDRKELIFLFHDCHVFNSRFRLVVKTANNGTEMWVKTLHKVQDVQVRKILAPKWNILQDHHPRDFDE